MRNNGQFCPEVRVQLLALEEDRILIVAVMHCSREPGYWKERVREKPPDGDNEL